MDDILIFATTLEELQQITKEVLTVLREHDLFLKPEKCKFHMQQVEFLGLIVSLIMNSRASGLGSVVRELLVVCTSFINHSYSARKSIKPCTGGRTICKYAVRKI